MCFVWNFHFSSSDERSMHGKQQCTIGLERHRHRGCLFFIPSEKHFPNRNEWSKNAIHIQYKSSYHRWFFGEPTWSAHLVHPPLLIWFFHNPIKYLIFPVYCALLAIMINWKMNKNINFLWHLFVLVLDSDKFSLWEHSRGSLVQLSLFIHFQRTYCKFFSCLWCDKRSLLFFFLHHLWTVNVSTIWMILFLLQSDIPSAKRW